MFEWNMEDPAANLPVMLKFTFDVVHAIDGKPLIDSRLNTCYALAQKILMHAMTIEYLCAGIPMVSTETEKQPRVMDYPSIINLTRAVLETYLQVSKVFFEEISSDEFEYRHAMYELAGLKFREDYIRNRKVLVPDSADMKAKITARLESLRFMRERIKSTEYYKNLKKDQRENSLNGTMFPTRKEFSQRLVAAELNSVEFSHFYKISSEYVHGGSLSAVQIADLRSEESTGLVHVSLCRTVTTMLLAKLAKNFAKIFEASNLVFEAHPLAKFRLVDAVIAAARGTSMK